MFMSDQRWSSCCTLSDGKHNNNNNKFIYRTIESLNVGQGCISINYYQVRLRARKNDLSVVSVLRVISWNFYTLLWKKYASTVLSCIYSIFVFRAAGSWDLECSEFDPTSFKYSVQRVRSDLLAILHSSATYLCMYTYVLPTVRIGCSGFDSIFLLLWIILRHFMHLCVRTTYRCLLYTSPSPRD